MRPLTAGILGAAALAAGLLLVRQVREVEDQKPPRITPAGESLPSTISLERIRALGY